VEISKQLVKAGRLARQGVQLLKNFCGTVLNQIQQGEAIALAKSVVDYLKHSTWSWLGVFWQIRAAMGFVENTIAIPLIPLSISSQESANHSM
jgi:hypothetical protein